MLFPTNIIYPTYLISFKKGKIWNGHSYGLPIITLHGFSNENKISYTTRKDIPQSSGFNYKLFIGLTWNKIFLTIIIYIYIFIYFLFFFTERTSSEYHLPIFPPQISAVVCNDWVSFNVYFQPRKYSRVPKGTEV